MIHPIVPITPTHSSLVIHPMLVILRYNNPTARITTPIASNRLPMRPNPGQKYDAYPASPMAPEAMESGAENESCQTNKNEISRPSLFRPYISRKYPYDPPDPGIAAPNSAHTSPSHSAKNAPSTQPNIACGPPIALMIKGMVMNGPTPIMSIMFSAVAPPRPIPRISGAPGFGELCMDFGLLAAGY